MIWWRGADRFVRGLNFRADMRIRPYGFGEDYTDTTQPPRQAAPATPPQEGNGLPLRFMVTMIWWRGAGRFVRGLNFRADMRICPYSFGEDYTDTTQPPRQAAPATPPQEGNGLPLRFMVTMIWWRGAGRFVRGLNFRADMRICPYGFGEDYTDTTQPPRQAAPATPPQEGNGLPLRFMVTMIWWRGAGRFVRGLNFRADMRIRPYGFGEDYTDTTQPPRQAAPATPPQEGNGLPLRFMVTMIWWRGAGRFVRGLNFRADMRIRLYGFGKDYTDTTQPPRQAEPATPPQEGNGLPLRFMVTMIWWRGAGRFVRGLNFRADMRIRPYGFGEDYTDTYTTTPSGCACHPSTGGEWFAPTVHGILFQQTHITTLCLQSQ